MEKRVSKRKSLKQQARIYRHDRSLVCGCVIGDISDTGVRLYVDCSESRLNDLPANFILSFTPNEIALNEKLSVTRDCQTVWSRGNQLGAKFPGRQRFVKSA